MIRFLGLVFVFAPSPAVQQADPIILPLSDFRREAVIAPTREGLERLGFDAKTLEGRCREELHRLRVEATEDPSLIVLGARFVGNEKRPPIRLTEVATVSIRPITFVPAAELEGLLSRLLDQKGDVRQDARLELYRLGGRAKNAVPALAARIEAAREYAECQEVCWSLAAIGPHAAGAVPALVRKLETGSYLLDKSWFGDALAAVGAPAVPELRRLFEEKDGWTQKEAARALARAGPEGLEVVLKALTHPGAGFRRAAAESLKYSKDRAVVPALVPLLGDADDGVRIAAAYSLLNHGPAARDAVPGFLKMLDSPAADVKRAGITGLGWIRSAPAQAVPRLLPFLKDSSGLLRESALQSLARFGEDAAPAVPLLPACLAGESRIRTAALNLVAAIGREAAPCLDAIRMAMGRADQDHDSIPAALLALAALGPGAAPAVDSILAVTEKERRGWAAIALGAIGPAAKKGLPHLVPNLFGYGSVAMPPRWTPRFMAAIDPDEAIRVLEADLARKRKADAWKVHDFREWTIEEIRCLKEEAREVEDALKVGGAELKLARKIDGAHLLEFALWLRKGDSLLRAVALLGAPDRLAPEALVYESLAVIVADGRVERLVFVRR